MTWESVIGEEEIVSLCVMINHLQSATSKLWQKNYEIICNSRTTHFKINVIPCNHSTRIKQIWIKSNENNFTSNQEYEKNNYANKLEK